MGMTLFEGEGDGGGGDGMEAVVREIVVKQWGLVG